MKLKSLVPLAYVRSVTVSIGFYQKLGFEVGNTHTPEGGTEPVWACLKSGEAQLMLSQASDPVDPKGHTVLFYLYCLDVEGFRTELLGAGVAAGPICFPFFNPRGEFEVIDPDGYVLMVTHT